MEDARLEIIVLSQQGIAFWVDADGRGKCQF
jgi:hypothetical protein